MKGQIIAFSPAGDTKLAEWEVGDAYAEEVARQVFDQARREGWAAVAEAALTPSGEAGGAVAVEEFLPSAATIYLIRPICGG